MPKRSLMTQLAEGLALEKNLTSGSVSQFVTVKQAAALLQVSERTVRRLMRPSIAQINIADQQVNVAAANTEPARNGIPLASE